jgi:hypothetical protein
MECRDGVFEREKMKKRIWIACGYIAALCATAEAQIWKPAAKDKLSWQWQIGSPPSASSLLNVDMYDVDVFDTPKATIDAMKKNGTKVTCYFSAGTYEGWRPDWAQYFPFITGADYQGTEKPFLGKMDDWDERWLDVREIALLKPIMSGRMKMAKDKGCDAVEPDNMDSYSNAGEVKPTGSYTGAHQIAYNKAVAQWAHDAGLSVALKNDVDQISSLVGDFDFALNEQCYEYGECDGYQAFIKAGKAVFGVEYKGDTSSFCPQARTAGFSWLKKNLDLGVFRQACNEGRAGQTTRLFMERNAVPMRSLSDPSSDPGVLYNGLGRKLPESKGRGRGSIRERSFQAELGGN